MKRLLITACILALALAAPALACDDAKKAAAGADCPMKKAGAECEHKDKADCPHKEKMGCDGKKSASFKSTSDTDVFYGIDGITPMVTELDNGVRIVVTAASTESLAKVEKRMGHCAVSSGVGNCPIKGEGVKRTVERTDEGLVITATSDDAETVQKILDYGRAVAKNAKADRT